MIRPSFLGSGPTTLPAGDRTCGESGSPRSVRWRHLGTAKLSEQKFAHGGLKGYYSRSVPGMRVYLRYLSAAVCLNA